MQFGPAWTQSEFSFAQEMLTARKPPGVIAVSLTQQFGINRSRHAIYQMIDKGKLVKESTEARDRRIVTARMEGATLRHIANCFGIGERRVKEILVRELGEEAKIPVREKKLRNPELTGELALLCEGDPVADIGKSIAACGLRECRYPIARWRGEQRFCAAHTNGGSWCAEHRAVVFPPKEAEKAA